MSGSNFQSYYNVSSSSYNQIVSNYKSLPRNSSNFQTGPNGTLGFYASNTYATRTGYFEQYNESNTWTVTESWEVIAPWVSLGAASSQGGSDWGNTAIDHSSKAVGGVGVLTKGRELVEWEYLRQAKFNRSLSGNFSQPVKHSLRALKNTGRVLGYTGVTLSGVDMAVNGVNISNSLDLIMGGVAFVPGFGWAVSGLYFVGNLGWQAYSGNTIGESIQSNFTDPNASWKPW